MLKLGLPHLLIRFVIVPILFMATAAAASTKSGEEMTCRGGLAFFTEKGGRTRLQRADDGERFSEDDMDALFIGVDPKRPALKIYPWLGIHEIPGNVSSSKSVHVEFATDHISYFSVIVTGKKTKWQERLICRLGRGTASVIETVRSESKRSK